MDLNTVWFFLVGVLITGYAILDGFDLGVGVLHLFANSDDERRIHLNAIGPVWDGNEVWLLTGGGALFAAFPPVYATAFSSFYLALVLLLVALIFRAVSMEFRGKVDSPGWRKMWDLSFGIGSLLAAVLFGVAVGNVLCGLPLDGTGLFTGTFFGLLNPYSVLIGLLTLAMFTMQGAAYMTLKSEGELRDRMQGWVSRAWIGFVTLFVAATIGTFYVSSHLFEGLLDNPLFWLFFLLLLAAVIYIPVASRARKHWHAFLGSSLSILCLNALAGVSLYPRMLPSSTDLAFSLTAYNASSTPRTLTVMLVMALIGMPIVIGYTAFIYRVFKGKVVLDASSY